MQKKHFTYVSDFYRFDNFNAYFSYIEYCFFLLQNTLITWSAFSSNTPFVIKMLSLSLMRVVVLNFQLKAALS